MPYTITITSDTPQALNFVKYAKTLDFVKVTKTKKALAAPDDLEEDENGIPIKYRDEIMAMSKQANRNMTKRWEAAIATKRKNNEKRSRLQSSNGSQGKNKQ